MTEDNIVTWYWEEIDTRIYPKSSHSDMLQTAKECDAMAKTHVKILNFFFGICKKVNMRQLVQKTKNSLIIFFLKSMHKIEKRVQHNAIKSSNQ